MSMIKLHCIKCPTINKSIFKETNEQDLKPLIQLTKKERRINIINLEMKREALLQIQ